MNKKKNDKTTANKVDDTSEDDQEESPEESTKLTAAKLLENAKKSNKGGDSAGWQGVLSSANKGSKTYARPGTNRRSGRNR